MFFLILEDLGSLTVLSSLINQQLINQFKREEYPTLTLELKQTTPNYCQKFHYLIYPYYSLLQDLLCYYYPLTAHFYCKPIDIYRGDPIQNKLTQPREDFQQN